MKHITLAALVIALFGSSGAFAQGITRAEVRQELVAAQQNGSQYVTDASYPDVSPIFATQADRLHAQSQGRLKAGNSDAESTPSSLAVAATASRSVSSARISRPRAPDACVGPVSFCNIYAGS